MPFLTKYGKHIDMLGLERTIAWREKTRDKMAKAAAKVHITGMRTSCPICNSRAFETYARIYGFNYVTLCRQL